MAVTLTGAALAEALAVNQALADRLLPVVTALVDMHVIRLDGTGRVRLIPASSGHW